MNRATCNVSDINRKDCMNHSILDAGLIVDHTLHTLAVTTLPLPPRHPCHPVCATCGDVETLPCILSKTDSLEKCAWIWFLDGHSCTENNHVLSIVRAFLMTMATCSGLALHLDSSPASNLASCPTSSWLLKRPSHTGREEEVTDDTADLAPGRSFWREQCRSSDTVTVV